VVGLDGLLAGINTGYLWGVWDLESLSCGALGTGQCVPRETAIHWLILRKGTVILSVQLGNQEEKGGTKFTKKTNTKEMIDSFM